MQRTHWTDVLLAAGLGLLALAVYTLTLTPSLSYLSPDGSELATVPYILGLAHPPGYPLYTWLGFLFSHLIPIRDVAWRMNLFSAVGAAFGVALAYLIGRLLLPPARHSRGLLLQRAFALAGAAALAFSPTLWSQAIIAEVYAPNLAAVTLTLLLLLLWARRPSPALYAAFALAYGLSLGTHLSNLGFAPAFALFTALILWQKSAPWRQWAMTVLAGGVAFSLGAAQFAWIPLRAASLPPGLLLTRHAPTTLTGLYQYTLGAFNNLRFAFPLTALPERITLYLYYLNAQFGLVGLLLGAVGMLAMPLLRPRRFWLLMGMYLAHLTFFLEYRAFDLEVFFIPVHAIWAWWMAFGWYGLFRGAGIALGVGARPRPLIRTLGTVLLLGMALAQGISPLPAHWQASDLSDDTAINDFYAAVWQVLPPQATLLSPSGVFGYDVFYWRLIYHTRSDVSLPALKGQPKRTPIPEGPLYATGTAFQRQRASGLFGAKDLWAMPVVLGEQPEGRLNARETPLVLLALQENPPTWKIDTLPATMQGQKTRYRGLTLLGARLEPSTVESGGALHLTLYWQIEDPQILRANPPRFTLRLGERALVQYTFGFGLLDRYAREVGLNQGDWLAIDYWIVIPSTVEKGIYDLQLEHASSVTSLGQIEVVDEHSPWDYWLSVAKAK